MPAIVISNEREGRVTDLRFARELRFLEVRHADDVHPPRAIDIRLGQGRERRPLHTQIRATTMHLHIRNSTRLLQHVAKTSTNRMRKRHVRDDPFAEESRLSYSPAGTIKKLIRNHHIER